MTKKNNRAIKFILTSQKEKRKEKKQPNNNNYAGLFTSPVLNSCKQYIINITINLKAKGNLNYKKLNLQWERLS